MIAVMSDLERIDRELAALGKPPEAVQPLLDEYGQRDRSLENVDVVLAALREGRDPASSPPGAVIERPSFLPLGWDAERKSDPGMEPAPTFAAAAVPVEREEITVTSGLPEEMELGSHTDSEPAAAAPAPVAAAPSFDEPEERPEPVDTQESFPPPPPDDPPAPTPARIEATVQAPAVDDLGEPKPARRESRPPRPDIQALLDTELDPREFPSTNPPPNISRSSLPPTSLPPLPRSSLTPGVAPSPPAAQDADFELLVDDDDIMEIDEEAE